MSLMMPLAIGFCSASPKSDQTVVVALDGSGDYTSIQAAINDSKAFPETRITIAIKKGVYYEKIKVHEWNTHITLLGESKEATIIRFDDHFDKIGAGRNSTFFTYTLLVEADDTVLKNLTIENTSGEVGQAIALAVTSTRVGVVNCNLIGNQDTLYVSGSGKQLYRNCYIEGTTDFIFGTATAYFENCILHCKKDSYITAAATPKDSRYGFVFSACTITAAPNVSKVFLGRPWRLHAKTVFLNTNLGSAIAPEGWHNWSKKQAETTAFFAEYNNRGVGATTNNRVIWAKQLTRKQATKYQLHNVLTDTTLNSNWYEKI